MLYRFCQRAGVLQFEQLGLGPPQGVACLRYLWNLQALLEPFIKSYTSLRAIATLGDLEDELVALLNSFCVPPLHAFALASQEEGGAGGGGRGDGGSVPTLGGGRCYLLPLELFNLEETSSFAASDSAGVRERPNLPLTYCLIYYTTGTCRNPDEVTIDDDDGEAGIS